MIDWPIVPVVNSDRLLAPDLTWSPILVHKKDVAVYNVLILCLAAVEPSPLP
jgi:hypothetical protein